MTTFLNWLRTLFAPLFWVVRVLWRPVAWIFGIAAGLLALGALLAIIWFVGGYSFNAVSDWVNPSQPQPPFRYRPKSLRQRR